MARILMVGSEALTSAWAAAMRGTGYSVEQCTGLLECQERFEGEPVDVLVVEIDNADSGEAMLMVQSRTVWPDCRLIAVARDRSYRSSAIFGMGLWQPDRVLVRPVDRNVFVQSICQLGVEVLALLRSEAAYCPRPCQAAATNDVILRCNSRAQPRWSLRPN